MDSDRLLLKSFLKKTLKLARLKHLRHNVTPADQLPLDENLREGGPMGDLRKGGSNVRVRKDIHRMKGVAEPLKDLDRAGREAALGRIRGPLYKNHDFIGVELVLNFFDRILHVFTPQPPLF